MVDSVVDSVVTCCSGVAVSGSVGESVVVGFSEVVVSGSVGGGAEVGCGVLVEVVDVMTTVLVGLGQGGWVGNDPGQSDVAEIKDYYISYNMDTKM